MKKKTLFCIICVVVQIDWAIAFLDPVTWGVGIAGISALYYALKPGEPKTEPRDYCSDNECCDDRWIPEDTDSLNRRLREVLHGQHIARDTIVRALDGYRNTVNPPKALAMSFNGLPGSGKNFIASMIGDKFFRRGIHSKYYHFFNGRSIAPDENKLDEYKENLKAEIVNGLSMCWRSIFVFDEVDMLPVGLLDALVPFMDYVRETMVDVRGTRRRVRTNNAIFIFLSNTGSRQIMNRMVEFWTNGVPRENLTLGNFENLITTGAFNERGGFHKSDAISGNLIDHYVPFLPLEECHVRLCMRDAFASRLGGQRPTPEMEEQVLSIVNYGPEPHNVWATTGCKKIEQKVISTAYRNKNR